MRAASLLLGLLLAGCLSTDLAADGGLAPADVAGIETLVLYLEGNGFTLEPDGLTSATIPLTTASTYRVSGLANPAQLEIFEFEDEAAAERGLSRLRAEVRSRVQQEVYASGTLVVYARPVEYGTGVNRRLRRALSAALGGPRGGA